MPKFKLILENSAGPLAESDPFPVNDETDVQEEVHEQLEFLYWALAAGDIIRIVEVE